MEQAKNAAEEIRRYWIATGSSLDVPTVDEIMLHREGIIRSLTEKQKEALLRRADNHETLRQAADAMGVSPERVRQLYIKALRNARRAAERLVLGARIAPDDEPIEMLGISQYKIDKLHANGIDTVGQLSQKTVHELTHIETVGETMARRLLYLAREYIADNSLQERAEGAGFEVKQN